MSVVFVLGPLQCLLICQYSETTVRQSVWIYRAEGLSASPTQSMNRAHWPAELCSTGMAALQRLRAVTAGPDMQC